MKVDIAGQSAGNLEPSSNDCPTPRAVLRCMSPGVAGVARVEPQEELIQYMPTEWAHRFNTQFAARRRLKCRDLMVAGDRPVEVIRKALTP